MIFPTEVYKDETHKHAEFNHIMDRDIRHMQFKLTKSNYSDNEEWFGYCLKADEKAQEISRELYGKQIMQLMNNFVEYSNGCILNGFTDNFYLKDFKEDHPVLRKYKDQNVRCIHFEVGEIDLGDHSEPIPFFELEDECHNRYTSGDRASEYFKLSKEDAISDVHKIEFCNLIRYVHCHDLLCECMYVFRDIIQKEFEDRKRNCSWRTIFNNRKSYEFKTLEEILDDKKSS